MEVTNVVTTFRRTMIGPVHTRQPDQPSPAATVATGPARTFTGPVKTQNIFQRMMNKRAAASEEAGADGLPELAAHGRERVAKKKKPAAVPRGPSKIGRRRSRRSQSKNVCANFLTIRLRNKWASSTALAARLCSKYINIINFSQLHISEIQTVFDPPWSGI